MSIHFMSLFSHLRCMKFLITRSALTTAMPNAVTRPMAAYDERQVLSTLLDELSPTQAARIAAKICGRKKSEMYRLAMELAETR